jgi:dienelactone hydrolase
MRTRLKTIFLATALLSIHTFASDYNDVRKGINLLYSGITCSNPEKCLNAQTEQSLVNNALAFKDRLTNLTNKNITPVATWITKSTLVKEFEFDSLLQREPGHPSNKVKGLVYLPLATAGCEIQAPATLLLHKLGGDIESEKQIAAIASYMNRGVVMLIYLPEYDVRKSATGNFITKSPEKFETNVLQALADVHSAYLLLRSMPEVKKDDIGLMGLSLGGMVTLISAGVDPIFNRYATNVGGGDLANIITYKKAGDVDSATAKDLKDIDWTVEEARFFLSRFDAITWSAAVKGKKVLMINAKDDELISKDLSVDKLISSYKEEGSDTKLIMHKGTHVYSFKGVGFKESISKVFMPMLDFMGKGTNCPLNPEN